MQTWSIVRVTGGVCGLALATTLGSCTDATAPKTISAPTNVVVTFVPPTSARVTWTASTEADRVVSYNIFRNSAKIGESTTTAFIDTGLAEGVTYAYTVSANGSGSVTSTASTASSTSTLTIPDIAPPNVTAVLPLDRSQGASVSTVVRVTFSEPINPSTLNASTFTVKEFLTTGSLVDGTRTYDAATRTATFTALAPFKNSESYTVSITTGVKDLAGNAMTSKFVSCWTPTAGGGAPVSMEGLWSGNDACLAAHWHLEIGQTGNTLARRACPDELRCYISAVSESGRAVLGGSTCRPTSLAPPRVCDVSVKSIDGTINGNVVALTIVTDNGLTFTFNGTFTPAGSASNPYMTGTISGATLPLVGINFELEEP